MMLQIILAISLAFWPGFIATSLLIPAVVRFALYNGIIDIPDARRIHTERIPRAGGLAVFLGTHLATAIVLLFPVSDVSRSSADFRLWFALLLGSACVTVVGLVDDLRSIRPIFKLAGQTTAALLLFASGIKIDSLFGIDIPWLLQPVFTVSWVILVTNIFNLIDGLDGLATGLAAIAALGISGTLVFRHQHLEALLVVGFIGACLGFLRFNRYPARLFLGDAGSNFIGFFLATLSIVTGAKSSTAGYLSVCFLALGVPMFDTLLAIWRRSNRLALSYLCSQGKAAGIMSPDLEHLHHRLLKKGLSQRDVVAFLYLANALLVLIGLVTLPYQHQTFGVLLLSTFVGIFVILRYVPMIELHDSALTVIHALAYPTAPVIAFCCYAAMDLLILLGAITAGVSLFEPGLFLGWFYMAVFWCSFPWFALILAEYINRRKGNVSGVARLHVTSMALALGVLFSFGYVSFWNPNEVESLFVQGSCFFALSYCGVIGFRLLPNLLLEAMGKRSRAAPDTREDPLLLEAGAEFPP